MTLPFSFSLCCTKSERRMFIQLHWPRRNSASRAGSRLSSREGCAIWPSFVSTLAIMFPALGAVKLHGGALCPMCNARLGESLATMSAFEEHKEELERYEQMFGRDRGRLAVSLDRVTNAL